MRYDDFAGDLFWLKDEMTKKTKNFHVEFFWEIFQWLVEWKWEKSRLEEKRLLCDDFHWTLFWDFCSIDVLMNKWRRLWCSWTRWRNWMISKRKWSDVVSFLFIFVAVSTKIRSLFEVSMFVPFRRSITKSTIRFEVSLCPRTITLTFIESDRIEWIDEFTWTFQQFQYFSAWKESQSMDG